MLGNDFKVQSDEYWKMAYNFYPANLKYIENSISKKSISFVRERYFCTIFKKYVSECIVILFTLSSNK